MKHFIKKHRYHFGLWFFSAAALIASTFWLNSLDHRSLVTTAKPGVEETPPALTASAADQQIKAAPKSSAPLKTEPSNENLPVSSTPQAPSQSPPEPPALTMQNNLEKKIPVAFKIETPDWSKDFALEATEGNTVYDAMVQLNDRGLLPIVFKQFAGLGAFVQSIGGVENSAKNNKFWIYYINDKAAALGISSIKLNPNDIITWKYEE